MPKKPKKEAGRAGPRHRDSGGPLTRFGALLAMFRHELSLTEADVADRASLSLSTVKKCFRAPKKIFREPRLSSIVAALDLDPEREVDLRTAWDELPGFAEGISAGQKRVDAAIASSLRSQRDQFASVDDVIEFVASSSWRSVSQGLPSTIPSRNGIAHPYDWRKDPSFPERHPKHATDWQDCAERDAGADAELDFGDA